MAYIERRNNFFRVVSHLYSSNFGPCLRKTGTNRFVLWLEAKKEYLDEKQKQQEKEFQGDNANTEIINNNINKEPTTPLIKTPLADTGCPKII